jgi:hypothetical protein
MLPYIHIYTLVANYQSGNNLSYNEHAISIVFLFGVFLTSDRYCSFQIIAWIMLSDYVHRQCTL